MRRSSQIPFVGREEQVAGFHRSLQRAAAGDPGVLVVGGDAGVGKTRLVDRLASTAEQAGARVVVAHCVDLGDVGIPYLPFTEALDLLRAPGAPEEVADRVADLVASRPALSRLLDTGTDGPTSSDPDGHAERLPLLDGIAGALAAAGGPGAPLVLVVEDLHWADPSTRDVLRFLTARLRAEHLLLVLTYRSDDVDRRHPLRPLLAELRRGHRVEHLELDPFTVDELRTFTSALHGEPLTDVAFDDVQRRSEGNAFFAEELLADGVGSGDLPWTLADMLHARLQHLDPAVQQLVRIASVAGRQVREDLLLAAAARSPGLDGPEAPIAALRDAVGRQVLTVEGTHVAFRHALLAEALALDLLPGERATVHRTYLAVLTESPRLGSAAERAHHAQRGHDLPTAVTASYEAATRAHELLAPAEELRHLETVLSLWESVPDAAAQLGADRVDVALAAAAAANRNGQTHRAIQLARRAVASLDDDPRRQAELRHLVARYQLEMDEIPDAVHETDRALAALGTEATPALAMTLATRGRIELNRDQDDAARDYLERAVTVARAAAAPVPETDALTSLAVLEVGDPDRAAHLLEAAKRRAIEAGSLGTEMRCWFNLAATRYYAGQLEPAQEVLDVGMARARETGADRGAYGLGMRDISEVLRYVRGDLTDPAASDRSPCAEAPTVAAARLYAAVARGDADAVTLAERLRSDGDADGFVQLVAGGCQVDALTWAGRHAEAVALADAVVTHLGAVWSTFFLGRIWISALALAALAGAAEEAAVAPDDPSQVARRRQGDDLLAVAQETARRGRPRGGVLGPEGRAWLQRAEAEHARLVAATGGPAADPGLWEAAVREFSYGYRYEIARSRMRWAQALYSAGDRTAAEVEAAEALREAQAMGAAPLQAAVRAWARRARVSLPGQRRETSVLTERESEVLALVAQGLSNRLVGQRLYISTKTVSVHVSNILAKLGVSGRTEAVAVATRRGLLPEGDGTGDGGTASPDAHPTDGTTRTTTVKETR